jgi:polyphenol oxidase
VALHSGRIGIRTGFGFTDRLGGVSVAPYDSFNLGDHVDDDAEAVARNRVALSDAIGARSLVFMNQVHGVRVECISAAVPEPLGTCDAMVTDSDVALAVLAADCVPVVLADDHAGVVAVAHVGRRGLRDDVISATLRQMRSAGASKVVARLGPCICAGCYEVSEGVRAEVAAVVPTAGASTRAGRPSIDLRAGLASALAAWDVTDVQRVGGCTAEDPDLYSYRRDGVTGRLAGVVWLDS